MAGAARDTASEELQIPCQHDLPSELPMWLVAGAKTHDIATNKELDEIFNRLELIVHPTRSAPQISKLSSHMDDEASQWNLGLCETALDEMKKLWPHTADLLPRARPEHIMLLHDIIKLESLAVLPRHQKEFFINFLFSVQRLTNESCVDILADTTKRTIFLDRALLLAVYTNAGSGKAIISGIMEYLKKLQEISEELAERKLNKPLPEGAEDDYEKILESAASNPTIKLHLDEALRHERPEILIMWKAWLHRMKKLHKLLVEHAIKKD